MSFPAASDCNAWQMRSPLAMPVPLINADFIIGRHLNKRAAILEVYLVSAGGKSGPRKRRWFENLNGSTIPRASRRRVIPFANGNLLRTIQERIL